MQSSPADPRDRAEAAAGWRRRVDELTARTAAAVAAGDLDALAALFAEAASWDDLQRAYQARCRIAEVVLAHRPEQATAWVAPFAATAAHLLDDLEREPREPLLLNLAGVLLYELLELGAATKLFQAALRLDPTLPHAADNLAQARRRGRSGDTLRHAGALSTRSLPSGPCGWPAAPGRSPA